MLEAIERWPPWTQRTGPADRGRTGTRPGPDTGLEERAVAHLEEELGDLLFQVYFHATLAAEAGRFTLADVARGVHDKLVSRHPHVFGDVTADTPEDVAANWEALKMAEKGRSSVTEGIPAALPALALAAKLQRKALAVGMVLPAVADEAVRVAERRAPAVGGPGGRAVADGEGGGPPGRRSSATCSSRWPTSPGSWGSTPRRPCGPGRPVPFFRRRARLTPARHRG